jgi:hypothetical protein
MKVRVVTNRSVVEEAFVEVDSVEHLKELVHSGELWGRIANQDQEFSEVCGEVLFNEYEDEQGNPIEGVEDYDGEDRD